MARYTGPSTKIAVSRFSEEISILKREVTLQDSTDSLQSVRNQKNTAISLKRSRKLSICMVFSSVSSTTHT